MKIKGASCRGARTGRLGLGGTGKQASLPGRMSECQRPLIWHPGRTQILAPLFTNYGPGHTTQNPHLSPHLQNGDNASTYLLRTPGTEEVLLFFSALKVTLSCSGYRGRLDCQALQDMMGKR